MKKVFLLMMAGLLMAACATLTPEEKAARKAKRVEEVKTALIQKKYKIDVNSMTPMRGTSRPISGRWIKVDSTIVECSLPYAGLDDIPHLKTRGEVRMDSRLDFKSEISDYVMSFQPSEKRTIITFKSEYMGQVYTFHLFVEEEGNVRIHLEPDKRDFIDYEGHIQ